MTKNEVAVMDWSGVSDDTKGKLIYFSSSFRKIMDKTAESFLECCSIVHQAHEELAKAGCKGKFSSYIENELKISRKTAYAYLAVHNKFSNCHPGLQFSPSALLELAKPDTTDEVLEEMLESPEPVTGSKVKAAKRQAEAVLEIPVEAATVTDELETSDEPVWEDVEPPAPKKADWKNHRVLAIKHLESAMRSADDLNEIHKYRRHDEVLILIKDAIQFLKDVK